MRRTRFTVPMLTGLVLTAAAVPATAPAAEPPNASTSSIRLSGGKNLNRPICGASQNLIEAGLQANAQAVVRAPKTTKGRRARKGTKLFVDKCANGAWTTVTRASLGARKKAKRLVLPTAKANTGDYRVRIVDRRNRSKGAPAYVRVGVGEIVDTPVTFTVKNQNRTLVPCLNSPDGGTYQVKGTLTAPRSVLAGKGSSGAGPDMALYYHGLGYGAFFWRFQAVPGYDYALDQVYDGHASVVVDRLGYGSSKGPDDGNKICYSSQADIGDQITRQMRSGQYSTGQGPGTKAARVAFVGHSAGSLLGATMQGAFQSVDAMTLVSYNNIGPTPLAGAQLTAVSLQCGGNPQPGPNGTRNYGRFGDKDSDFKAAHLYNIEPAVEAAVLKMRSPDPCGDVFSIGPSFLANQGFERVFNIPVQYVVGGNDALFVPVASQAQFAPPFSAFNADNTLVSYIPDTGHAVTLGRTHEAFRNVMSRWLKLHGF